MAREKRKDIMWLREHYCSLNSWLSVVCLVISVFLPPSPLSLAHHRCISPTHNTGFYATLGDVTHADLRMAVSASVVLISYCILHALHQSWFLLALPAHVAHSLHAKQNSALSLPSFFFRNIKFPLFANRTSFQNVTCFLVLFCILKVIVCKW